jgi:hypothetical protein
MSVTEKRERTADEECNLTRPIIVNQFERRKACFAVERSGPVLKNEEEKTGKITIKEWRSGMPAENKENERHVSKKKETTNGFGENGTRP